MAAIIPINQETNDNNQGSKKGKAVAQDSDDDDGQKSKKKKAVAQETEPDEGQNSKAKKAFAQNTDSRGSKRPLLLLHPPRTQIVVRLPSKWNTEELRNKQRGSKPGPTNMVPTSMIRIARLLQNQRTTCTFSATASGEEECGAPEKPSF